MSIAYGAGGHGYYARTPITGRAAFAWPAGAHAAFAILVSAEYYEMQPLASAFMPPNLPGGFGRGPYPDYRVYSARAYGNRVGIYRVFEALERSGLRATVALDALSAKLNPRMVGHILRRGDEIAGHGQSVNRVISALMSEQEERDHIRASLDAVEHACGVRPAGWHGPEYGESSRTPALLAELGVSYVLDWPNDEQPVVMTTPHGSLLSIPMLIDFDDVYAQVHRRLTVERWAQCVEDGIDQLIADASGRLLVLNLHPWLIGHPFRSTYLVELLDRIAHKSGLWRTTTGEIAAWYRSQLAGTGGGGERSAR